VADHSGAQNIFIIDDPPDDFYGNMQPIDDQWIVDVRLSDGTDLEATCVRCAALPGVVLTAGDWLTSGRVKVSRSTSKSQHAEGRRSSTCGRAG